MMRRAWLMILLLLSTLGLEASALASAEHANDVASTERTLSPYFFLEDGDPKLDRLPLQATDVEYSISGPIANVTVTQQYRNTGKRPINAKYVFPASTRAAVHGMTMRVGERVIKARIREREKAREEFESAKKQGKTASLLEQDRPNVFSMNVANVMPGDRVDVTLEYTELLVPTKSVYELVFPTVVGPRYGSPTEDSTRADNQFVASPYLSAGSDDKTRLDIHGTVSVAVPLKEVTSSTHKLLVQKDSQSFARVSLDATEASANNRDYVLHYRLSGDAIQSGLSLYEQGGEKYFALIVEPPARVKPDEIPPREYVFVLDVSGSMHGFPLDTAKTLMRKLIGELRPVDRFNVMLFSGASSLMSPRSLPATKDNLQNAIAVIDRERGGGGTELLPALQRALTLSSDAGLSRHFVVVTDGFVSADREAFDIVVDNRGRANVYSFGIGSSVNRFLIDGLARAGLGEPFIVLEPRAATEVAQRFHDYVSAPVLTDVELKTDGFDVYDVEPKSIPDVLAERPIVVHGKYRGRRAGKLTLTGVSGLGPYKQTFDAAKVAPRPENAPLRYLWARTRISELSDYAFGEPTPSDRKQIVALGLEYNLLTQFTSFVAVSEVVRNTQAPATDVRQPLVLPEGVSNLAVGAPIVGAPEPGFWVLSFIAVVALELFRRTLRAPVRKA